MSDQSTGGTHAAITGTATMRTDVGGLVAALWYAVAALVMLSLIREDPSGSLLPGCHWGENARGLRVMRRRGLEPPPS
jgi:hypothetical protein